MGEAVVSQRMIQGFTRIYGEPIQGDTRIVLPHLHGFGPSDDGRNSTPALVRFAAENNYDIALTPHNSQEGVLKALRYRDNNGYRNVAIPSGEEYAAIDKKTGKHTHIIVLGANHELPPGLDDEEAIRAAHRAGGVTVAAHPGLGNYSTSIERIRELNKREDPEGKYDLVEVFNASVHNAEAHGKRLGCLGEKLGLPKPGLNRAALVFMENEGGELGLGYFAGSDAHGLKQADDVLLEHSSEVPFIEALMTGNVNILLKNDPSPVTIVQFAGIRASNIAGKVMRDIPLFNALYHAR